MIILDESYTAEVETSLRGEAHPVIVVRQDGRRTPGSWFAETLAGSARNPRTPVAIDAGAGWTLSPDASEKLMRYAVAVHIGRSR